MQKAVLICGLLSLLIGGTGPAFVQASQIRTTYTSYSIYTHRGQDILCEPYLVKEGDWLYKIFRKKGEISETDFPLFLSMFKALNPGISDLNAIEAHTRILIPLKAVDKGAYPLGPDHSFLVPVVEFSSTIAPPHPAPSTRLSPLIWEYHFDALKRYAGILGGNLRDKGVVHFPPGKDGPAAQIDLAQYPVVELQSKRLLFHRPGAAHISSQALGSARNHWKDLSLKGMTQVRLSSPQPLVPPRTLRARQREMITRILLDTGHAPPQEEAVSFSLRGVEMSAQFQRIHRENRRDILINFNTLKGDAGLSALAGQGFLLLHIPRTMALEKMAATLLETLGYHTWENPAFIPEQHIPNRWARAIPGLLAQSGTHRHFFAWNPLGEDALQFLETKDIHLHYLH